MLVLTARRGADPDERRAAASDTRSCGCGRPTCAPTPHSSRRQRHVVAAVGRAEPKEKRTASDVLDVAVNLGDEHLLPGRARPVQRLAVGDLVTGAVDVHLRPEEGEADAEIVAPTAADAVPTDPLHSVASLLGCSEFVGVLPHGTRHPKNPTSFISEARGETSTTACTGKPTAASIAVSSAAEKAGFEMN